MRIDDLVNFISFPAFYDVCRTKLNNTFVMYDGEYGYCQIADGPHMDGEDNYYQYGSGKEWIFIDSLPSFKGNLLRLNTLEGVDTEPVWPDVGYYYFANKAYKLSYPNNSIYKAGLSPGQINLLPLRFNHTSTPNSTVIKFLNRGINNELIYPTLSGAKHILITTKNVKVPLTKEVLLEAHPYNEFPIVTYKDVPIGVVKEDILHISPSNKPLEEYFAHEGIPYA